MNAETPETGPQSGRGATNPGAPVCRDAELVSSQVSSGGPLSREQLGEKVREIATAWSLEDDDRPGAGLQAWAQLDPELQEMYMRCGEGLFVLGQQSTQSDDAQQRAASWWEAAKAWCRTARLNHNDHAAVVTAWDKKQADYLSTLAERDEARAKLDQVREVLAEDAETRARFQVDISTSYGPRFLNRIRAIVGEVQR